VLVQTGPGGLPKVMVTDFGLATTSGGDSTPPKSSDSPWAGTLTESGAVMGTPGYMPPEQVEGRADARSDQFSFCVALYEALCDMRPFGGADALAIRKNVLAARGVVFPDEA